MELLFTADTFCHSVFTSERWQDQKMVIVIPGYAHYPPPQTEAAADDDETIEMTTPEAHGDERMIVKALTETVHAVDPLAAHLGDTVTEETEIGTVVIEENDLQVLQTRIAEGAGIAATDTATTVNATANDLQGDIEAPDRGPVLHDDHEARKHYSEAARFLHNRTHFQMR